MTQEEQTGTFSAEIITWTQTKVRKSKIPILHICDVLINALKAVLANIS